MKRTKALATGYLLLLAAGLVHLDTACGSGEGATAGADADIGMDVARAQADADASTSDSAAPPGDSSSHPADASPPPNTNPCLPFAMPPASDLFGSKRRVFAHYFSAFPLSIDDKPSAQDYYNTQYLVPGGEGDAHAPQGGFLRQRPLPVAVSTSATWQVDNMKKEIAMAIRAGITGFTIDVLDPTGGPRLQNLLAAAAAVDSRFKIVVMPDLAGLGANQAAVETIVASVASSPAALRLADGRLVVTAFDAEVGSVAFWTTVLDDLADAGTKIAFVPTFLGWGGYAATYGPLSYGFADWGTATPQACPGMQAWPAEAHDAGRIFMMPVDPQQYRPKDFAFWEAGNSLAFRDAWTSAIAGGSDWVQLVTWSDFSESSEIEPYTDSTLAGNIGTGFYDLNAYYASWFLTGQAPAITEDVLFYFHRREPTGAAAPAQAKPTTPVLAGGGPGQDLIEVLGFLTEPGTLEIRIGGQTFTKSAPAGLTSFTVPLQPGTPTFALSRGGTEIFSGQGTIPIVGDAGLASGTLDLTYWSGSVSKSGTCDLSTP